MPPNRPRRRLRSNVHEFRKAHRRPVDVRVSRARASSTRVASRYAATCGLRKDSLPVHAGELRGSSSVQGPFHRSGGTKPSCQLREHRLSETAPCPSSGHEGAAYKLRQRRGPARVEAAGSSSTRLPPSATIGTQPGCPHSTRTMMTLASTFCL